MADKQISALLTSKGKPQDKIDCIAWLLLNVFGCSFCKTCRDKPCKIKDGEFCTDNIANYIREAVKEENADVTPISEVEKELQALRAFKDYFDSLYGQGLEIANWHSNGKLEPYETFYDSAYEEFNKYIGEKK